ncbi:hypothetical protein [Kitasatospora kifunensis]|uniref:Uncharacterized protein n=1 Tax=Kitasatospora kifunensis TaxID=58351 RepID=A0A7W7QY69_KITKI|nr:hypothetical protein [Kitasatospora kifunensis]MBB4921962.1 hypothetical protein [Kitasatospora kifunensis]
MSSHEDLAQQIRALSDAEAVRALAALVEERGLLADTAQLPGADELRDAVATGDREAYLRPGGPVVTDGELARVALEGTATLDDGLAAVVGEAVEYAQGPMDRFDLAAVSVAALVITLLQTEVTAKRDTHGKWSLTIRKQAVRDSALGRLLTALLSQLTGGK